MSKSNPYALLDLAFTLVDIAMQAEEIRAEADALKASGKTDDEVRAHLRVMCDAELKKLQDAVK